MQKQKSPKNKYRFIFGNKANVNCKIGGDKMRLKECVAMILAGGQGSRLGILTQNVAKPAVPFGGKYRIIDFPLSNCSHSGIDTVGVLTQYQPLELNTYIANGQPWDLDRTTEVFLFFLHTHPQKRANGIKEQQTLFIKIWGLWNSLILNMLLFYQVTIFIKWTIPKW